MQATGTPPSRIYSAWAHKHMYALSNSSLHYAHSYLEQQSHPAPSNARSAGRHDRGDGTGGMAWVMAGSRVSIEV